MTFTVIPFCRIVKFSGITRFLYQFWKILTKYCGRKEKDHNILWSKWYSRRESNPQRPLRRGLLYPFNYGSIFNFIPAAGICRNPIGVPSAECRASPSREPATARSAANLSPSLRKYIGAVKRLPSPLFLLYPIPSGIAIIFRCFFRFPPTNCCKSNEKMISYIAHNHLIELRNIIQRRFLL